MVDRQGVARVAELGLVARTPGGRWIPGTPEYMAPELWSGDEPTIGSDIYAATVVLVTSTEAAPRDAELAREAGANFYLVKPVSRETLLAHVALLCGTQE